MTRLTLATALVAAALPAASAAAQGTARAAATTAPRAFITLRGADTLVTERVEPGADGTTTARLTFRGAAGQAAGLRFVAVFVPGPDARVRRATLDVTPPAATAPVQRATMSFEGHGDSVQVSVENGPSTTVAVAPGTLPYVNLAVSGLELILRRARAVAAAGAAPGAPATIPLYAGPGTPAGLTATVTRLGADSAVLSLSGVEIRMRTTADDRILGARVPAQGILIQTADPLTVSALGAPAGPPPKSYAAPAGAPYSAEDVRVPTPGGFALAGTLTHPAAAGPAPVVVTITGSGPEDRDEGIPGLPDYVPFRQLADTLARRGIAVLRLDDRGVGASGGTFATATSRDFADDVRAALAYLRARAAERRDVDAQRLALLGHSEGGMIAPMVAADDPGVAALVLLAGPAYTGRRIMTYQMRRDVPADASVAPARRDSLLAAADRQRDDLLASSAWNRYFAAYDPLDAARRVRAPVLILQGATDRQVTPEQADTLAAAFRAGGDADVTTRVFADTDHLFLADPSGAPSRYAALPSKSVRPEVLGAVADWLSTRLARGAR